MVTGVFFELTTNGRENMVVCDPFASVTEITNEIEPRGLHISRFSRNNDGDQSEEEY
jgi:hypothetical protein